MPRTFAGIGRTKFIGMPRLIMGSGALNRSNAWMRLLPIPGRSRIVSLREGVFTILRSGGNGKP